jgi:hypothetical protein
MTGRGRIEMPVMGLSPPREVDFYSFLINCCTIDEKNTLNYEGITGIPSSIYMKGERRNCSRFCKLWKGGER